MDTMLDANHTPPVLPLGLDRPGAPLPSAWLSTRNERMRELLKRLEVVAPTTATVLLRGETGTGKEVLARVLHAISRRRKGPFFSLNCGSLHESLLESELFGHERGAFTGAVRRKRGLVELAAGGTLFLDEIGELSKALQVKLLRVLQQREFMRVGGEEVLRCDIRVVAATHRNLEAMMREGQFRADLFYRLEVVPVVVPPLRERLEDLPDLAVFLLRRFAEEEGLPVPRIAPGPMAKLLAHSWPGNIRELENVLLRALLLCTGGEIADVSFEGSGVVAVPAESAEGLRATRSMMERGYLMRLLGEHRGNVKAAALAAGVDRRTLYRHLSSLRIDPGEFRARSAA
jgi:transcriptional regulator with PAS, ATPase and Fis domain